MKAVILCVAVALLGFNILRSGDCKEEQLAELIMEPRDCGVCPQIYRPVCASDGLETQTFPNECTVEQFNCLNTRSFNVLRSGDCNGQELPKPTMGTVDCGECPQLYLPVCASDGKETKTFPNKCTVERFNCLKHRKFNVLRSGDCNSRF